MWGEKQTNRQKDEQTHSRPHTIAVRDVRHELLRAMLNADLIGFLLFGCRVTLATLHHLAMPPLATLAPPYIFHTIHHATPPCQLWFRTTKI